MGKSKNTNAALSFLKKMMAMKASGISEAPMRKPASDDEALMPLEERLRAILGIVKMDRKTTEMVYFIMYDIENNKIRRWVSKFLEKKGFLRVQRSIFLARSERHDFDTIANTLREVNEVYDNDDSIILIPVSSDELRSINLIGKNVDVKSFREKPNALIF